MICHLFTKKRDFSVNAAGRRARICRGNAARAASRTSEYPAKRQGHEAGRRGSRRHIAARTSRFALARTAGLLAGNRLRIDRPRERGAPPSQKRPPAREGAPRRRCSATATSSPIDLAARKMCAQREKPALRAGFCRPLPRRATPGKRTLPPTRRALPAAPPCSPSRAPVFPTHLPARALTP